MQDKKTILVAADIQKQAAIAAEIFCDQAESSVMARNRFFVALSGGTTPRSFYRLLASDRYRRKIPWSKTYIFWVDDRCVPSDSPDSNYGAAKKDFINKVGIPINQVFPMPTTVAPERGARQYEETIVSVFAKGKAKIPSFDFILLGVGIDGHIGSLFPGQHSLWGKNKLIIAVKGGKPDVDRLTMNVPLINRAKYILFLVNGLKKAEVISDIFSMNHVRYPAQRIHSINGKIAWLLDLQASINLPDALISKKYE